MITLITNKGNIKIRKNLLTLVLSLSTSLTLTGCSKEKLTKELEIKKNSYTIEQLKEISSQKEYKIKNQAGNSKVVFHIFDSHIEHNINTAGKNQIENVKLEIKDDKNNIVDIFTTTKNKEYVVKHLTPGKYTIEIISIPKEYTTLEEKYSFTIEDLIEINNSYLYTINYIDIPLEKVQTNTKKLVKK